MSGKISLIRDLPFYTEKASGRRVQALKVMFIVGCPRGQLIIPVDQRYAAFEVATAWVDAIGVTAGDFVIWEEGNPITISRPDDFEARFRPAAGAE